MLPPFNAIAVKVSATEVHMLEDDEVIVTDGVTMGLNCAVNVSGILEPQALLAVTDINAGVVPAVRFIEFVLLVPSQPMPVTVHV